MSSSTAAAAAASALADALADALAEALAELAEALAEADDALPDEQPAITRAMHAAIASTAMYFTYFIVFLPSVVYSLFSIATGLETETL